MALRLLFMIFVAVFVSFQAVMVSARPVFDATEYCDGFKTDTCGTFAAPAPSPRASQASRILMDSSVSEECSEAQECSEAYQVLAALGPRGPPSVSAPGPGRG